MPVACASVRECHSVARRRLTATPTQIAAIAKKQTDKINAHTARIVNRSFHFIVKQADGDIREDQPGGNEERETVAIRTGENVAQAT